MLKRIPEFYTIAEIVKHHHTKWHEWDDSPESDQVMTSQVVFLADYIERLINRDRYILHQVKDITGRVNSISEKEAQPQLVKHFLASTCREEFWLDLTSPRLYSLLFHNGPLKNIEIDYSSLENISKFFRDIIDFKSPFTATHTSGVSACAEIISRIFGLTKNEIQQMKIAGNFHDLGKLIIPNKILEKPARLTEEEFDTIKCHTYYTYYIINSISGLKHIAEWAAFHHERLNNTGYPFHCSEQDISTCSRIMAVADVFTAIAEDRPYRKGMSRDNIIGTLKNMADNNALDANIVELLVDNYTEIFDYVKTVQESAVEFYHERLITMN